MASVSGYLVKGARQNAAHVHVRGRERRVACVRQVLIASWGMDHFGVVCKKWGGGGEGDPGHHGHAYTLLSLCPPQRDFNLSCLCGSEKSTHTHDYLRVRIAHHEHARRKIYFTVDM